MFRNLATMLVSTGAVVFFAASCMMTGGYNPPPGSIFTQVKMNKEVVSGAGVGKKSGKACAQGFLGVFTQGDASVKAAAAAGNIGAVKSVDYSNDAILGSVYTKVCTIANGD